MSNPQCAGAPVTGGKKLEFVYDYMGRRVEKVYSNHNGTTWVEQSTQRFVYDGWNVTLVLDENNDTLRKYTWGLDMSQTIHGAGGIGGSGQTVSEDFNTMPSWSSSYDASWGSAATWSIVSGGQSGNALQASRSSQGSSAKVKVYNITANTNYTISIYIKCPSFSGSYWAECAYRLGSYTAENFDQSGSSWTMIKKFANDGTNGNGNTWVQYSLQFNSGSNTQISVGYKLGSSGGGGPTVLWDTLRVLP